MYLTSTNVLINKANEQIAIKCVYNPQVLPKYMNIRFKHSFLSLLIQLFIGNWLLTEQHRFRGPWLCITNWSNHETAGWPAWWFARIRMRNLSHALRTFSTALQYGISEVVTIYSVCTWNLYILLNFQCLRLLLLYAVPHNLSKSFCWSSFKRLVMKFSAIATVMCIEQLRTSCWFDCKTFVKTL
jgi:hypothetical protein